MELYKSILFGVIQGIAEFLPISSSGHLEVMKGLLGVGEVPRLFDVLLHIPTLIVVVIVFRKRILEIFKTLYRLLRRKLEDEDKENLVLTKLIIIASIPTAIIGIGLKILLDKYQDSQGIDFFQQYPWIVGILFLVTAGLLIWARFFSGSKSYKQLGIKEGLFTGLAQGIGVLPGISRSGITITASVMAGIDRQKAGEYSFLISIPAILGATIVEFRGAEAMQINPLVLLTGMVTCLVVGFVSLLLLLKLVKNGRLYLFAFYLIPVGILSIIFLK